jgi:hypothetical protein
LAGIWVVTVVVAEDVSVFVAVDDLVAVTVDFSVDDSELVAVLVLVELGEDDVAVLVAVLCNVETCVLDLDEDAVDSKVVDSVDTALDVSVLVAVVVAVVIGVLDAVDVPVEVSVVTSHVRKDPSSSLIAKLICLTSSSQFELSRR